MIILLHNIRSAHNVGSIFRTADATGCEKIYLCGITPAPVDKYDRPVSRITKVSLGAEKYIPWEKVKSTARLINKLKKQRYQILALEQSKKSIPYYKFKLKRIKITPHSTRSSHFRYSKNVRENEKKDKFVLILGNEIKGLPCSILHRVNHILEIPIKGKKESFNVAVAFGIVAFHLIHTPPF